MFRSTPLAPALLSVALVAAAPRLPGARPSPAGPFDQPGDPANAPARVDYQATTGALRLTYDGRLLFEGTVKGAALTTSVARQGEALTQEVVLKGRGLRLSGTVAASRQALAAEAGDAAQKRFPLVRTSIGGPSRSLRNDAIYDRKRDWSLDFPGGVRILPRPGETRPFALEAQGDSIRLVFRPRFFQIHRNLVHFRPWTYDVRQDSITGWSSWWAFFRDFNRRDLDQLLAVWKDKRLADFGYRFIQIDDGYQGGEHARHTFFANSGYEGGHPATWLEWRADRFPGGMTSYAQACREAGFEPGIWIGSFFSTQDILQAHPDWFVRGRDGVPFRGPWIGAAIDATRGEALDALVRPTYAGAHRAGFTYVKIDQLRHYLYDNLNRNLDYCRSRGASPDAILRDYLGAARRELGPDTFLLACWGVLPEAVGLADACRIGGDGYGPMTMQQYNSWNGIVWRNDPDHCDVRPTHGAAETGNVTRTTRLQAEASETILRPALASIAGCMLMLSDRPEVYRDEANLEGIRRASPVLFSVPGQLYDFSPERSRNLVTVPRGSITSGAEPSPIDALQFGEVCPWWLNEFNLPSGSWVVLHRLAWGKASAEPATVRLADLGMDPRKDYVAYEFWSRRYLGVRRGTLDLDALGPNGLASVALRERQDHPQIVSTSRHLSQGGPDLVAVAWSGGALSGTSRVIQGDRYELDVRVPSGFHPGRATVAGAPAQVVREGELLRVAWVPAATGAVAWRIAFEGPGK